jgi:hypothetical protein
VVLLPYLLPERYGQQTLAASGNFSSTEAISGNESPKVGKFE